MRSDPPAAAAVILNDRLATAHPAARACLSDLGVRLFFPKGIPAQTAEARGTAINATIGQITRPGSGPVPLRSMARHLVDLDLGRAFLYPPVAGFPELREAWWQRLAARGPAPETRPLVVSGLTHGLSICADLFTDPDTTVVLPDPGWGNYDHIFQTRRGARLVRWRVLDGDKVDAAGLARILGDIDGKGLLVLNFPGNPTGFTPAQSEIAGIVEAIQSAPGPLVVVNDDAYAGLVYEPGLMVRSLFYELVDADKTRLLTVKVDGATKELSFFGGRVSFLTFGCGAAAGEVLTEKASAVARATISFSAALPQELVLKALRDPDLENERDAIHAMMAGRYRALKRALAEHGLVTGPFNSGMFALVPVSCDPEALRILLLSRSVGVVSIPSAGAVRLSYGGVPEETIPDLVAKVAEAIAELEHHG